jgi:hypothetical protein
VWQAASLALKVECSDAASLIVTMSCDRVTFSGEKPYERPL